MKEKNYRGAAIHEMELQKISQIGAPNKIAHFQIDSKYEIRNFEVCKSLGNGRYLCQYVNVFHELTVPIEGNPLDKSNLEMADYLYQLEHGKGTLSIITSEDSEEESSQEGT